MIDLPTFQQTSKNELANIKGVCLDIDDTLSTDGKLTPQAFDALWKLHDKGFAVVPVTGRPAGWCDHIARFWPVDAIIGENGAFIFFMKDGILDRLDTPDPTPKEQRVLKLNNLKKSLQASFSQVKWASDQHYRENDLAIDIKEDVPPWSDEDIDQIMSFCKKEGAACKLSSIHINTWFGDFDKQKAMKYWLEMGAPGLTIKPPSWDQWLYIGDSPNDEPAFASFKFSVGVANIKPYLPRLNSYPTWITEKQSGDGFVEMANKLTEILK